MAEYVTYIVVYSGDRLPPYYIGSTSLTNIGKGYLGSVRSRKWKKIFDEEVRNNRDKFELTILERFSTRKEALEAERELQIELDVVKSGVFYNESIASVDGFFGRDVSGENNPMYGKPKSELTLSRIKEANSGKFNAICNDTNKYVKLTQKEFDKGNYSKPTISDHQKNSISKSTSRTMRSLVNSGNHWFQSEKHKKLVGDMRRGVPISDEQKSRISKTRVDKFKRPWNCSFYGGWLDFDKVVEVFRIYSSIPKPLKSGELIKLKGVCRDIMGNDRAATWVYNRISSGKSVLQKLESTVNLYIKEKKIED